MADLSSFLPPGRTPEQMQQFALRFESLGGHWLGCEMGQVQRLWRAEPMGLLRWSAMTPRTLTAALQDRFEGVGEPEYTRIFVKNGQYWTDDTRWMMTMNACVDVEAVDESAFRLSVSKRLRYLRQKLISDLTTGEKVFVFKMTDRVVPDHELLALYDVMRSYGENSLLYVTLADEHHFRGCVRRLRSGLLVGYIDRFAAGPNGESLGFNTAGWYNVLSTALAMCRDPERAGASLTTEQQQGMADRAITPSASTHDASGNRESLPEHPEYDCVFGAAAEQPPNYIFGWSVPEKDFTWTDGPKAALALPTPAPAAMYDLMMYCSACIHPQAHPKQTVITKVNGVTVGSYSVSNYAKFHCQVPGDLVRDGFQLELEFPDAVRPSAVFGSQDSRLLGACFRRLQLKVASSADAPAGR